MTIRWADIRSEYEGLETGFRERVVRLFEKYEGQPTDEVVRGKTVMVTVASFAKHMGLKHQTFARWVSQYGHPKPETCVNDQVPPREGFIRKAQAIIEEAEPYIPYLSADTFELIEADIKDLEKVLRRIRTQMAAIREARV